MAKFCSQCGAKLNELDNFCPRCGKEIIMKKNVSENQSSASSFLKKFFTLKGRLNRWAYFKYSLILSILPIVLIILLAALSKSINSSLGITFYGIGLPEVILLICILTFIIGGVILPVRRLHDLNLNGWWCIIYYLFIGLGNMPVKENNSTLFIVSAVCGLIGFICSMFLLFKRGTIGDNKYGKDPLEIF